MSWDAYLIDPEEGVVLEQNYTHNCNKMISTALEESGYGDIPKHWLIGHLGGSWFDILNEMPGDTGAELLDIIIEKFINDPKRFKAMNPPNGWGSYETLLPILIAMRDKGRDYPNAKWEVHG